MTSVDSLWSWIAGGVGNLSGRSEPLPKLRSVTLVAFALALLAAQLVPQTLPDIGAPSTATFDRTAPAATAAVLGDVADLPLVFERDGGRYRARGAGYLFAFGDDGASMSVEGEDGATIDLTLAFVGANEAARPTAGERAPGVVNYVMGDDPDAWRTVPTFHEVVYEELWPGIDMVFTGTPGALKYDFVVAPGANAGDIALAYRGASDLSVTNGALQIATPGGTITDSRPVSHQRVDGTRTRVPTRFEVSESGSAYGFAVGAYDRAAPLRIDPALVYSTFLGGNAGDEGQSIAVDSSGNAYVTGITSSTNFPTTTGAFQRTDPGSSDAFVTKLNARGTAALYSTYLGGSAEDEGFGITVSGSGEAITTGTTSSANFPTTTGAFQRNLAGASDAFVTKFNSSGKVLYSTYLGGSGADHANDVARDGSGNAYVTGSTESTNFPTTLGAFRRNPGGSGDAFVTKINPTGTATPYSTYLGGSGPDAGTGIATHNGNAFTTGTTNSSDFPTTPGALQTSVPPEARGGAPNNSFVTQFNVAGSQPVYSTYLGESEEDPFCDENQDMAAAIAVDGSKNAYVTGFTDSCTFPVTGAFLSEDTDPLGDAFVLKLNPNGSSIVYSVLIGGFFTDAGSDIALDGRRNAFVAGSTVSNDFPTTPGAFQTTDPSDGNASDGFMLKLNPNATKLLYSSYLGGHQTFANGVAVGGNAHMFVTGLTFGADFPTSPGAFRTTKSNDFESEAFVTRVQP